MAVRIVDLTDSKSQRLQQVEVTPRRRDLRRTRQRYAALGLLLLAVPFFGALVVLGVAH